MNRSKSNTLKTIHSAADVALDENIVINPAQVDASVQYVTALATEALMRIRYCEYRLLMMSNYTCIIIQDDLAYNEKRNIGLLSCLIIQMGRGTTHRALDVGKTSKFSMEEGSDLI